MTEMCPLSFLSFSRSHPVAATANAAGLPSWISKRCGKRDSLGPLEGYLWIARQAAASATAAAAAACYRSEYTYTS